jgi:hypothetical protein
MTTWFEDNNEFCFYGSSLLLVYEGDTGNTEPSCNPNSAKLRFIDFAHVCREGRRDEGVLYGLRRIIAFLEEVMNHPREEEEEREREREREGREGKSSSSSSILPVVDEGVGIVNWLIGKEKGEKSEREGGEKDGEREGEGEGGGEGFNENGVEGAGTKNEDDYDDDYDYPSNTVADQEEEEEEGEEEREKGGSSTIERRNNNSAEKEEEATAAPSF